VDIRILPPLLVCFGDLFFSLGRNRPIASCIESISRGLPPFSLGPPLRIPDRPPNRFQRRHEMACQGALHPIFGRGPPGFRFHTLMMSQAGRYFFRPVLCLLSVKRGTAAPPLPPPPCRVPHKVFLPDRVPIPHRSSRSQLNLEFHTATKLPFLFLRTPASLPSPFLPFVGGMLSSSVWALPVR